MQITQVHYQKLVNLGDFQNERIGAWAHVSDDETPEEALADLTAWVESQGLSRREVKDDLASAREQLNDVQYRRDNIKADITRLKKLWEKAAAIVTGMGMELPPGYRSWVDEQPEGDVDEEGIPF